MIQMLSSLDYDLHHGTATAEATASEATAEATAATATTTTTATARHTARTHALTTTAPTTEEAILTTTEDVGTEDDVEHSVVSDSVVLRIAALHSTEHTANC